MFSFQSARIDGSKFDAPEDYSFTADRDASFGKKTFDIPVAEIEPEVQPDGIADSIGRESVSLVGVHALILASRTD